MAKNSDRPAGFPASAVAFLKKLKSNNNREWFNANKDKFLEEQGRVGLFAEALLAALNTHDMIETLSGKQSLYRIYRDTRFSKNKTPYKTNWSGYFKRAGKQRRGGYYYHIEPGNSFIAGGFWGPNPADLKRIRDEIAFDDAPLRNILNSKSFVSTFETLQGEQVKTTPRGFDAGNAGIDLLRFKQFLLITRFTDAAVLSETFAKEAGRCFRNMRPFFDYMSEVLSTGANGIAE
jgi:uncharacterized protein (TIGR02453 family)